MKSWRLALLVSLMGVAEVCAADVGVSVSVGEPGFYGQINIGGFPPPELIYSRPVLVAPPVGYAPPPMYLRVPPGYERHWGRHCRKYHACGVPVYFVRDQWYRNVYVPHYREHWRGRDDHGGDHGNGGGPGWH